MDSYIAVYLHMLCSLNYFSMVNAHYIYFDNKRSFLKVNRELEKVLWV